MLIIYIFIVWKNICEDQKKRKAMVMYIGIITKLIKIIIVTIRENHKRSRSGTGVTNIGSKITLADNP